MDIFHKIVLIVFIDDRVEVHTEVRETSGVER